MSQRRYIFEVVKGRQRGRRLDVADDEVRVGRIMASHRGWLRFSDRSVSRDQAVLRWDDSLDRYVVTNSSETNPTRVNGEVVSEKVLEDGDEICMGDVVLRVVGLDVAMPSPDAPRRAPLQRVAPPTAVTGQTPPRKEKPAAPPRAQPPSRGSAAAADAEVDTVGRLSRAERARLLGEIGIMLRAGISLARILDGMRQRASTPATRGLCRRMLDQISRGRTLSAAMRDEESVFSPLHAEAVAAGERCGKLDVVLSDLGAWEDRDLSLTRAVASALTYPMTVLACGVLLVLLLGNRVLTALTPVFTHTGKPLPLLTKIVLGTSSLLQHPTGMLAIGTTTAVAVWGAVAWWRTSRGRRFVDAAILRLPITGRLTRMLFVARFCNQLKLLYGAGIALLPALTTSLAVTSNTCLRERVAQVTAGLRDGQSLAEALARTGEFPALALSMIEVGEETARLEDALGRLCDLYDQEVYTLLEQAVKLLEPAIIVGMGVMVAFIVLATLLPLYQLVDV